MSMNYGFKKLSEAEIVQSPKQGAHFVLEEDGMLKRIAAENIEVGGGSGGAVTGGAQPDWEQNDASAHDYIKNRPFYDAGEPYTVTLFAEEDAPFGEMPNESGEIMYVYGATLEEEDFREARKRINNIKLSSGIKYEVVVDDQVYIAEAKSIGPELTYLGNPGFMMPALDTGENYFIFPGEGIFALKTPGEKHNIAICENKLGIKKEIIPDGLYSFTAMETGTYANTSGDFSALAAGDQLTVKINNQEFQTSVALYTEEGMNACVFGNAGMLGLAEISNEPFMGAYMEGMSLLYYLDLNHRFGLEEILSDGSSNVILEEQDYIIPVINGGYIIDDYKLQAGTTYKIIWDGEEYTSIAADDSRIIIKGDNLPFIIYSYNYQEDTRIVPFTVPEVELQVEISGYVSGVKKIDPKYIPDKLQIASESVYGSVKVAGEDYFSREDYSDMYAEIYHNDDTSQIVAKLPIVRSHQDLGEGNELETGTFYLVYE